MPVKQTTQLVVGDVIVQPVADNTGRILVPGGTAVTDALVNVLQRRGVESVHVREEWNELEHSRINTVRVESKGVDLRVKLEGAQDRLREVFGETLEDPTMAKLFVAVRDHVVNKLADKADTAKQQA